MTTTKSILLLAWLTLCIVTPCAAHNVSGTVTCGGRGVEGVAVSDGYEVVITDSDGHYSMTSNKKNGYVFYTLPSGYEPELIDGFKPRFWAPLDSPDPTVVEEHDFTVQRVDNDHHIVIFGADTHLARRNSDRAFFKKGFIASLKEEAEQAGDVPIYSVLLGDLTWDVFWTQNEYDLHDYMSDMKSWGYPMTMWPVIGNHDHDPSIAAGATTDFDAAEAWREIVCPNYYSFNLGKIHYVVLDDIDYLNEAEEGETYSEGVVGSRNYRGAVTAEQLNWLRKDLAQVDYSTPVVVCLHIPAWSISSSFYGYTRLDNTYTLCSILKNYSKVHFVSGHNHGNYTVHPSSYPNITEHNLAAVCGTLWQSACLTGHNVCHDGSPAGYAMWTAKGKALSWTFKPTGNRNSQLRLYDMNTVREFYRTNNAMRAIMNKYPSRDNYSTIDDNVVMVNVFAYDTDWKVSICEGDSLLECRRVYAEDPFHTINYEVPNWNIWGNYSEFYATSRNTHMFKATAVTATQPITVRVVDSFGNVFLRSISRPHTFSAGMESHENTLVVGDVNSDNEVNIADVNCIIDMVLSGSLLGHPLVFADCNADNEVNIADVNHIIDIILNF